MAVKEARKEIVPYKRERIPSIFDEMDRFLSGITGRGFGPRWFPSLRWPEEIETPVPAVDVFEDDSEVTVKAEIPGVKKEDLKVDITDDSITISGEKKKEEKVEEKDYYRVERSYGSFSRTLPFPSEIQSDKVNASFKDGVLMVKAPKKETKKKVKVAIE